MLLLSTRERIHQGLKGVGRRSGQSENCTQITVFAHFHDDLLNSAPHLSWPLHPLPNSCISPRFMIYAERSLSSWMFKYVNILNGENCLTLRATLSVSEVLPGFYVTLKGHICPFRVISECRNGVTYAKRFEGDGVMSKKTFGWIKRRFPTCFRLKFIIWTNAYYL